MKVGTDGVLLGAWADVTDAQHILDIGAGTGVIAIMLAQRSEDSLIHAVEIDTDAFEQAAENMKNCPWSERLQAFHASIQDFANTAQARYDLIVSNPPFFSGGTFSNSQDKNSVRHTVKLPHGDLLMAARKLLSLNGKFCAVLPSMEGLRFREMASSYNLYCTKLTEVKPKPEKPVERLLLQFERQVKPLQKNTLTIHPDTDSTWTQEYAELTGAFYTRF